MQLFTLHPHNPQDRLLKQAVAMIHGGAVIALPTDASYVLACHLGDKTALDRIRSIRRLDPNHLMTLLCKDLSSVGSYAKIENSTFRLLKSLTPGPFTFILTASREVPKRLLHPKRKTIGLRIPDSAICHHLLSLLTEPLLVTTLTLSGEDLPLTEAEEIYEKLQHHVDLVIDGGSGSLTGTTVIDATQVTPILVRQGLGDAGFQ
ncbi:MAG: tRNA threonylcarbamoyl adenosine modification protein Sua5/YciO/YrdC/YwlC family [Gammaproteobacteria bacterium]|jgi:tRNA threonylcarbamoyl adenosine modification protein (Sua5/YciO/YrdC/YwlC family)|nr:tRNA threonylcarbamoyl adenosine modification protein Sua5/YciO/YrdC/YwlC family [Gammaproteobacteria bacterium]